MLLYFIALTLIIGIMVCFVDLKKGVIKNKYILLLLSVFLIYFYFNLQSFNIINFILNSIWIFFIGFFLYLIDLWSAGDAKIFIVLSLLLSVFLNGNHYIDFLINSFVPMFLIFVVLILIKSEKNEIKKSLKYAFKPYNIFLITSIYVGFSWFLMIPLYLIGIPNDVFVFIIVFFILMEILSRVRKINLEYLYIFLVILRVIIDYKNVFTFDFLATLFAVLFVFIFFRFFILRLAFRCNVKNIRIEDLKPGMETAEGIKKVDRVYKKISLIQINFYDFLAQKKDRLIHNKTLTENDVEKIKNLKKSGKLNFNTILIHESIPFAIFLYVGFILTLVLQGNFVQMLLI